MIIVTRYIKPPCPLMFKHQMLLWSCFDLSDDLHISFLGILDFETNPSQQWSRQQKGRHWEGKRDGGKRFKRWKWGKQERWVRGSRGVYGGRLRGALEKAGQAENSANFLLTGLRRETSQSHGWWQEAATRGTRVHAWVHLETGLLGLQFLLFSVTLQAFNACLTDQSKNSLIYFFFWWLELI